MKAAKAQSQKPARRPIGEKIARAISPSKVNAAACVPIVRGLKEPFTLADVARACKIDDKKATNIVQAYRTKEWLESVNRGEYQRTPHFGGVQLADIHNEIAATKKKDE